MIRTHLLPAATLPVVLVLAYSPFAHANEKAVPRRATFEARHELKVTVPDGTKMLRVWFTTPQGGPGGRVSDFKVESPFPHRIEKDSEGNEVLFAEVENPSVKDITFVETFVLDATEQGTSLEPAAATPLDAAEMREFARYLEPNANILIDDEIRALQKTIVGEEKNPVAVARRIYDWVLDNVDYWVKDPANKKASPVGSSAYCLDNKCGNCSDFHSLWTALARASGIPTRMVFGSYFKASLDGVDKDQSYHCWVEYYIKGAGWVPLDVSAADILARDVPLTDENRTLVDLATPSGYPGADPTKADYYFSHIEERRVTWSRGRDLILSPRPAAATPLNALIKAYVEADGVALEEKRGWERKLTYRERK
ncbi:MAG: transglutaminase domain-containing protein [Planctomycetes bacterium]|nr:transglutaminase domain-containing protein [Planctomycetota bacterium]